MPIPDATYSTLQLMIQDVRELCRAVSPAQISDQRIMYHLNSFMLYDMPESLRLKSLRTTFDFYTSPYVDVYDTNTTDPNNPFYNFKNKYVNTFNPFYCAGWLGEFTQSRESFYGMYPNVASIILITYGNNVQQRFSGFISAVQSNVTNGVQQINVCLVRNQVLFSSIDANGNGLSMIDTPISALIGNLSVPNNPPTSLTVQDPDNYINYVTGQYVVTFPTAPGAGKSVMSQTMPVAPAQPQTILWFDDKFILRPVPNMPYKITVEANIRPAELLSGDAMPKLGQWYQYIVYGTATKIYQYRMDSDSVAKLAPEFKRQELLVGRTTIVQNAKQRVPTIFVQGNGTQFGPGFGFFGNGNI